jgi:hypothetical protein
MVIKKGTHAPFRLPKLLIAKNILAYNVTFTESCRYDIGDEDQGDINKLFGFGYFPHHHKNSVRFGWNYNLKHEDVSIFAYWYKNGKRMSQYITSVNIGVSNIYTISADESCHILSILDSNATVFVDVPSKDISYLLRPYFGGNQTAPHDMRIVIDEL